MPRRASCCESILFTGLHREAQMRALGADRVHRVLVVDDHHVAFDLALACRQRRDRAHLAGRQCTSAPIVRGGGARASAVSALRLLFETYRLRGHAELERSAACTCRRADGRKGFGSDNQGCSEGCAHHHDGGICEFRRQISLYRPKERLELGRAVCLSLFFFHWPPLDIYI